MQFCWQVKWMNCINPKKINLISSRKHMSGPKPVPVTRNNSWSSRDFKFDPRKEGLQLLTWSLHCLPWDISELTSHSQHQLIVFFFFSTERYDPFYLRIFMALKNISVRYCSLPPCILTVCHTSVQNCSKSTCIWKFYGFLWILGLLMELLWN